MVGALWPRTVDVYPPFFGKVPADGGARLCSVFDKYDYIGIVFGQGFNDQQTPLAAYHTQTVQALDFLSPGASDNP
jgi:hypothetical protein